MKPGPLAAGAKGHLQVGETLIAKSGSVHTQRTKASKSHALVDESGSRPPRYLDFKDLRRPVS